VAADIDGTFAKYHPTFVGFCSKYFNRPFKDGYDGSVDFEEYLGLSRPEYRAAKLAYRQGGNKRWLPVYDGAVNFCLSVRALGAELWLATTRPWQRLDNVDPDTQEWLQRNGVKIDGLLFGDDKYHQLCEHVGAARVVAVVDDLGLQIDAAKDLGLNAYQVLRQHNSGDQRDPRLPLAEIYHRIEADINKWRIDHE